MLNQLELISRRKISFNFIQINFMKKLLLTFLVTFLIPFQLFADGPFLYSLPFGSHVYPDEAILEKTKEKGIDYSTFENYLLDNNNELGKKVGLISELEVFFVLNDNQKPYFIEFKDKFKKSVQKKYGSKIPINERFLIALMNDYDTESPKVEVYQKFVDENSQSRTMQFINVFAFNFDLIWNSNKREYTYLNNFKERYQDNCLQNFDHFNNDTSADVFPQLEEIITLGYDCGYNLKCLAPSNNILNVMNQKTDLILNKLANAEPIPPMWVSPNASLVGMAAYEWLGNEMNIISSLKITDEQKTFLNYLAVNETYLYVNHIDHSISIYDAIGKNSMQFTRLNILKSVEKIVPKNEWKKTNQFFTAFKKEFDQSNMMIDSNRGLINHREMIYYFYLNPNDLLKVFQNQP